MCVRDIASAGARYDLERLRDLQASEVATQARETASALRVRDSDGTSHADCKHRDKALHCQDLAHALHCPLAGPHPFSLDNPAQPRGSTAAGALLAGGDGVGPWPLGGRGSSRERAATARSGQVEELARSVAMAGAAQATRNRCSEIRRERERVMVREDELFHHVLYERERGRQRGRPRDSAGMRDSAGSGRQRDTALAILETCDDGDSPPTPPPPPRGEGTRVFRPSVPQAGPVQQQLTAAHPSRAGAALHMQHGAANSSQRNSIVGVTGVSAAGDGGAFLASGGGGGPEGSVSGAIARAKACATGRAAAQRDELDPLLALRGSRSRAPLVLKVAAGKDRTLHE